MPTIWAPDETENTQKHLKAVGPIKNFAQVILKL